MIKRKLSQKIIKTEEYQIWNSFIDILAMESEDNLSDIQKHAQRAFWYDSEIQNGGHLQYFENQKMNDFTNVLNSLKTIGASQHAYVLKNASEIFLSKHRKPIQSILGFITKAKKGEYDKYDSEYYEINPDMNHYLNE